MSEENVESSAVYEGARPRILEICCATPRTTSPRIQRPSDYARGNCAGKAGRSYFAEMLSFIPDAVIEVDEVIGLGEDRLGITTFQGAPADEAEGGVVWCHLLTFRGGLIAEVKLRHDRESALEAPGLTSRRCRRRTSETPCCARYESFKPGDISGAREFLDDGTPDLEWGSHATLRGLMPCTEAPGALEGWMKVIHPVAGVRGDA